MLPVWRELCCNGPCRTADRCRQALCRRSASDGSSRRLLILGLAGSAVAIASRPFRVQVGALALRLQDTPPPPMVLRSASGGEQEGGIGTYCWGAQCVDMLSTPYPECPLAVTEGEALTLDVSALGRPSGLDYAIWNTAEDDLAGEPSSSGKIDVEPIGVGPIPLAFDLSPGRYAIEIFGQYTASGDSTQGFTLLVQPAGNLVTPEVSPVAKAASAQDCK
jgi:hypothetical protein